MASTMITALSWVPRGHAKQNPTRYELDPEEYERIAKMSKLELEDAKEGLEEARQALSKTTVSGDADAKDGADDQDDDEEEEKEEEDDEEEDAIADDDDDLKEYDMEHYDDEPDVPTEDEDATANNSIFGNIKSLAYHKDQNDDEYLTLPADGNASDDEEREELQILPTDNLVLAARIEDEVAHLECYVYEDEADNLYVHHDVMLPAIPLCVEWLNAKPNSPSEQGSFAAVGTMDPEIELWDLDIVDAMFPTAILGPNPSTTDPPKKKKKKSKTPNPTHHTDAVLSLTANHHHRNLLASASADRTTKLWDLTTCTAAHSYTHHTDKVCALRLAPDPTPPSSSPAPTTAPSDVEHVRWDPHNDHTFYVSTETGVLHCFDARHLPPTPEKSRPTWRLQAHESPLSTFSLNPAVPGFIATGSVDRQVKIWDVFSAAFAPDDAVAFRLAVAGSKGAVQVWDTSTNRAVREAFATRVKLPEATGEERLVGVEQDDEVEEEEAEAEENGGDGGWESMDED
ncbi:putative WD repeat-containing protein [Teratosphaeria destructans]|uniref:WD repeat-containing protein n=1 Tax=Teratosphaeria destructans TaxID=418781 RepID=A0A9W7SXT0_9PEZI|nr:putative WD repeat-containing protein [Teratosphaeria destructans]